MIDLSPLKLPAFETVLSTCKNKGIHAFPYANSKGAYYSATGGYSSYFKDRPSRLKNTIRRKQKKLAHCKFEYNIYKDAANLQEAMEEYDMVYKKSWKVQEPYPDFIAGLADIAAKNNWLRLGILRIEGKAIASQLWLVAGSTAFIYKLAYNSEYSNLSPGTLLTDHMMRYVLDEDNVITVDFLTGEDNYKRDWMDHFPGLYGIQFGNCRTLRGCLVLIWNYIADIKKVFSSR